MTFAHVYNAEDNTSENTQIIHN